MGKLRVTWTQEEVDTLYEVYTKWFDQGDASQFFRMVRKALPHRTFRSELNKLREGLLAQKIPYRGSLPETDAKERDTIELPATIEHMKRWQAEQKMKREVTSTAKIGGYGIESLLIEQNKLLLAQNRILADTFKFIAGIYRLSGGGADINESE